MASSFGGAAFMWGALVALFAFAVPSLTLWRVVSRER